MARTTLTAQTLAGAYPVMPTGLVAGSADLIWTAANVADKNETALVAGKTVVLARNVAASASHTVTFTSCPDGYKRIGDMGPYTVAAGKVALFGPFGADGWSLGGLLQFEANHADIQFVVLTL